jgi:hypothetical protein
MNEKGIIKIIKEVNDFLNAITGIGILINRLFEINMQVCVQNKDREEVLKKVLERLESTVVNIDNLSYRVSDFLTIGHLKLNNLNIDRFFS